MPLDQLLGYLPDIKRTAKDISEALGYRGHALDMPEGEAV
jgi:hypothetical protein